MNLDEKPTAVTRSGRCFCGAVTYVVTGDPINVRACHCDDCQRFTGSAFFVRALFLQTQVKITGTVSGFPSSDDLTRKFCSRCGSQLFAERKSRGTISIALSSFDDLKGMSPSEHVWVSDKQAWLFLPRESKQHERIP